MSVRHRHQHQSVSRWPGWPVPAAPSGRRGRGTLAQDPGQTTYGSGDPIPAAHHSRIELAHRILTRPRRACFAGSVSSCKHASQTVSQSVPGRNDGKLHVPRCPYAAYAARPTPHSASRPEPRPCKRAHPAPNGAARAARVRTRGTPDSSLCAAATQVAQGANPHAALLAVGLESNPRKLQNIKTRARKLKASF